MRRRNREDLPSFRTAVRRGDYARILFYFAPYKTQGTWMLMSTILMSILGLIPAILVRSLIDIAIPNSDYTLLSILAFAMVFTALAAGFLSVGQSYLNSLVGQGVMFDLRNEMYTHLQKMSLRFYSKTRTGEIMSRINDDVGGIQNVVTGTFVTILTDLIVVISTLILIAILDWRLTIVGAALLPLFIWPSKKAGNLRREIRTTVQTKRAQRSVYMQETLNISGFLLVRSFAKEQFEAFRFSRISEELTGLNIRLAMVGRWFFMLLGLYGAIGPAIVYWYGGRLIIQEELSIGTLVAFTVLLTRLFGPASSLASVHVDLTTSLALFERIFAYLDLQPDVKENPSAVSLENVHGHVRFRDVSFSYDKGQDIFNGMDIAIEAGSFVALVGPSGSGKTTFTYLLTRLYDPETGTIAIDGHDIRDVTLQSLNDQIGTVPQDPFLFHDTVYYNVAYGVEKTSLETVEEACKAAQIHDVIVALPNGYETLVGERGHRLSGGEIQRLAIARVLLKDPRILIFDEATSAVDSIAEAQIQRAVQSLTKQRTTIAIAHRLSTILAADVILVLDNGKIVESGIHSELINDGGLYAQIYEEQFSPEGIH
ncbi:ABC transporter ATP-binding protein/permease [Dehalococcoidia bacterium]|nr:ABC transporter ATP-binding protein/permease [Dehalococcoidia bacterium]